MENKCPYCDVYAKIYLKSDSKIDIEQIDYSCTENSRLEKDYKPIDDMRASSKYRMDIAKNLLFKFFFEIKNKTFIRINA